MQFVAPFTTVPVILSEAWQGHAKSKDLRTIRYICSQFGAKILRLALLAQDDKTGTLYDKPQFTVWP